MDNGGVCCMKEAHPGYHVEENVLDQLAVHSEQEIVQAVVQAAQYAETERVKGEIGFQRGIPLLQDITVLC